MGLAGGVGVLLPCMKDPRDRKLKATVTEAEGTWAFPVFLPRMLPLAPQA